MICHMLTHLFTLCVFIWCSQMENLDMRTTSGDTLQRLHTYEIASLANLAGGDTTPEEAIAWIPSLALYDDDSISMALEHISKAKSRLELPV